MPTAPGGSATTIGLEPARITSRSLAGVANSPVTGRGAALHLTAPRRAARLAAPATVQPNRHHALNPILEL